MSLRANGILERLGYIHEKHSEKEYARGDIHINNCKKGHNTKTMVIKTQRGISKDRLETYLKIFKANRKLTKNNKNS